MLGEQVCNQSNTAPASAIAAPVPLDRLCLTFGISERQCEEPLPGTQSEGEQSVLAYVGKQLVYTCERAECESESAECKCENQRLSMRIDLGPEFF